MRATIKDIARELGISTAAVSKALSNKGSISDALKEKVKEKAKELNYQRNEIASRFASQKSRTIGVVFFDNNLIEGTEIHVAFKSIRIYLEEIKKYGYDLLLFNLQEEYNSHIDILDFCLNRMVEGVIVLWAIPNQKSLQKLLQSKLPTVIVESPVKGISTTSMLFDNEQGITLALNHLFELGHTKIAFLKGHSHSFVTLDRLHTFEKIMKSKAYWNPDFIFEGDFSLPSGYNITKKILALEDKPTAILATGDLMAIGLIRGLEELGCKVPEDISIMGYDGFEIGQYLSCKLTTIKQDLNTISQHTIKNLFAMIESKSVVPSIKIPVELIKGETTAAPKIFTV